ncbi:putative phage PS3 [Escherichia coli]|nr:putative phage PS3 [Escherichia coli]
MSNTFKFSSRSVKNLQGVNPDLVKVTRRALEISEVDFGITEGLRSRYRQKQLVATGKSQTMNSPPPYGTCRGCCGLYRQPGVMGMAAVRKNRSSIQTGQPGTEYSGGMGRRLEDPERRTAFSVTARSLSGMKLWPTLGVAFLLIAAWGASMRLSWSLGRENARNEAQASTLKSTVDTLNIISAGVQDMQQVLAQLRAENQQRNQDGEARREQLRNDIAKMNAPTLCLTLVLLTGCAGTQNAPRQRRQSGLYRRR